MESTHEERRRTLIGKRRWIRIHWTVIAVSVIVIIVCRLQEERRRTERERAQYHSFGTIGRIIRIEKAECMHEHVRYVPTVVTLENEYADETDRKTVRVIIENWMNHRMGDVWRVRLIDPTKKGGCTLQLEELIENYPWRAEWRRLPPPNEHGQSTPGLACFLRRNRQKSRYSLTISLNTIY